MSTVVCRIVQPCVVLLNIALRALPSDFNAHCGRPFAATIGRNRCASSQIGNIHCPLQPTDHSQHRQPFCFRSTTMPPRKSNLPNALSREVIAASADAPALTSGPSQFPQHSLESLAAAQKQVAQAPRAKRPRRRNIAAELDEVYGDRNNLIAAAQLFDVVDLPFIVASTRRNHESVRYMWIEYFTWLYASEELALATLKPKAALPTLPVMKAFIHHIAISGKSNLGVPGLTGWSYKTTIKNLSAIFGMVSTLFPTHL